MDVNIYPMNKSQFKNSLAAASGGIEKVCQNCGEELLACYTAPAPLGDIVEADRISYLCLSCAQKAVS